MRFQYQQIFIFIEFFLKYEDNFRDNFAICLSVSPNKTRDETAKRKKRGTVVFFCRADPERDLKQLAEIRKRGGS